jgi:hypothetical protein
MRLHVDGWDPSYVHDAASPAAAPEPGQVTLDLERAPKEWGPLPTATTRTTPDVVFFVDGVRRIDGRLSVVEDDGAVSPGLAASYAAGVVRCDLRDGHADVVASQVERRLFTPSAGLMDLMTPTVRYSVRRTGSTDLPGIEATVQADLRALEEAVATTAAPALGAEHLIVVDGPRHRSSHDSRLLGYVKTHPTAYLPPELARLAGDLGPGERSPVFRIDAGVTRHSWYLGLPVARGDHAAHLSGGSPRSGRVAWAGIVRLEADGTLPLSQVVALADRSCAVLPRFASHPYKDRRAPQNLVPIGGLEQRLRHALGEARLLHRGLVTAAAGYGDL